jgi:hypothetical protein
MYTGRKEERVIPLATDCSLKCEDIVLTEEALIKKLNKIGVICNEVIRLKKGIKIDETFSKYGFSISLIDTSDDPFGYESKFLSSDFEYNQSLNFRLDNEWDSIEATKNILMVVFEIIDSTDSNLLFLHNDNECLYKIDGILRINNEEGFWHREEYRTLIQNQNFQEI